MNELPFGPGRTRPSIVEDLRARGLFPHVVRTLLAALGVELPPAPKSGQTYLVFCPFHRNTNTPAMWVAEASGYVRCEGACRRGWKLLQLADAAYRTESVEEAGDRLRAEFSCASVPAAGRDPPARATEASPPFAVHLDPEAARAHLMGILGEARSRLRGDPDMAARAAAPFGVTGADLDRLGVGLSAKHARRVLAIPMYDPDAKACGIRFRRMPFAWKSKNRTPKRWAEPRETGARNGLFGLAQLVVDPAPEAVFVVEGETDWLRLAAEVAKAGLPWVVVGVPGVGTNLRPFAKLFAGLRVVVLYDVDDAGRIGALNAAEDVSTTARSVVNLRLAFTAADLRAWYRPEMRRQHVERDGPPTDVRDWLDIGHDVDELARWARTTPSSGKKEI